MRGFAESRVRAGARTPDGEGDGSADPAPSAHTVLLVVALAAGLVAQGGYYLPGRILVTVLAVAALVAALRVRPWVRADAWPVAAAGTGLALWALVRAAVADAYPAGVGVLATLGCLMAVLVAMGRTGPAEREWAAQAIIAAGVLVAVTAWLGVAWRMPRFVVLVDGRLWRGASTLTYPNATAALLVPLVLLAVAMLAGRPRSVYRAVTGYLLLVGVGAALSRAGFIALLVGLAVLGLLAGVRPTLSRLAPLLLGAGIAVGALVASFPAAAAPHQMLAVAGLLIGAFMAIGPTLVGDRVRAVAVVGGLVLAGLIVAGLVVAGRLHSGYLHAVLANRANLDSSGRSGAIEAAFRLVAAYPLAGTGVGQARFVWFTGDGNAAVALYAHNEYLQLLVDLGAIGLALLLVLFLAIVVTIRRGRGYPHRPGIRAGALAGLAAFAVHSGFDFLWHIAVLPLAAALLIGLAGPGATEESIPTPETERQ